MSGKLSKRLLDKLREKTNVQISEGQLKTMASRVSKDDLKDEKKIRQLLKQLAAITNMNLTPEKEDKIINYIKKNGIQNGDIQTLTKLVKDKI